MKFQIDNWQLKQKTATTYAHESSHHRYILRGLVKCSIYNFHVTPQSSLILDFILLQLIFVIESSKVEKQMKRTNTHTQKHMEIADWAKVILYYGFTCVMQIV